ncbi:hypothetical protein [Pseudogemmobacter sp. W21_MBD1_M6]|uniref:hypothetical protein n=1 Tax=Pseudogemmobacter sp. W21_MBD1_M6 TaxID=3240271 RepID=UPI003F9618F8
MSEEIQRAEVIDWWEAERARIYDACLAARETFKTRASAAAADLSMKDLLMPSATARTAIERQIQSDVNMLNRRLAASLQSSFEASVMRVEGNAAFDGATLSEMAALAGSGALALGTLGLVATATSFATTTATFMFFVPVTTVSWPLFAVVGASAVAAAYFFVPAREGAEKLIRDRFLTHLDTMLERLLTDPDGNSKSSSSWSTFRSQIDQTAQLRLKGLS